MGFLCGSKNPNWNGGKKHIERICIGCGKIDIIEYRSNRTPSPLCSKCSKIGELNGNWKNGITKSYSKDKVIKVCPECGIEFKTSKSYKTHCSEKCGKKRYTRLYWKMYHPIRKSREATGKYKIKDFITMIKTLNYKCPCCHNSFPENKFSVDHIVPLSKGGLNTIDNIQPLCLPCNMRKGVRTHDYVNH